MHSLPSRGNEGHLHLQIEIYKPYSLQNILHPSKESAGSLFSGLFRTLSQRPFWQVHFHTGGSAATLKTKIIYKRYLIYIYDFILQVHRLIQLAKKTDSYVQIDETIVVENNMTNFLQSHRI